MTKTSDYGKCGKCGYIYPVTKHVNCPDCGFANYTFVNEAEVTEALSFRTEEKTLDNKLQAAMKEVDKAEQALPPINAFNKTHGRFSNTARIAQEIKRVFDAELARKTACGSVEDEALALIATHLARILSGDATHIHHWQAIADYALLVVADRNFVEGVTR